MPADSAASSTRCVSAPAVWMLVSTATTDPSSTRFSAASSVAGGTSRPLSTAPAKPSGGASTRPAAAARHPGPGPALITPPPQARGRREVSGHRLGDDHALAADRGLELLQVRLGLLELGDQRLGVGLVVDRTGRVELAELLGDRLGDMDHGVRVEPDVLVEALD